MGPVIRVPGSLDYFITSSDSLAGVGAVRGLFELIGNWRASFEVEYTDGTYSSGRVSYQERDWDEAEVVPCEGTICVAFSGHRYNIDLVLRAARLVGLLTGVCVEDFADVRMKFIPFVPGREAPLILIPDTRTGRMDYIAFVPPIV
jgi:hypothetical protein